MTRRPPRSTRTDTLVPYTALFRSTCLAQTRIQPKYSHGSRFGSPISTTATLRRPCPAGLGGQARQHIVADFEVGRDPLHVVALVEHVQHLQHGLRLLLVRSEEHTSELQSLMRISYAVFCLKKKKTTP